MATSGCNFRTEEDEIALEVLLNEETLLNDVDLKDDLIIDHLFTEGFPQQIYERIVNAKTRNERIQIFLGQLGTLDNISKTYSVLRFSMVGKFDWIVEKMDKLYDSIIKERNSNTNEEDSVSGDVDASSINLKDLNAELEQMENDCPECENYNIFSRNLNHLVKYSLPREVSRETCFNTGRYCWLRRIYSNLGKCRESGGYSKFYKVCRKLEKSFRDDVSVQIMVNCQKIYSAYIYKELDGVYTLISNTKKLINKSDNPLIYLAMTLNVESCIHKNEGHLTDAIATLEDAKCQLMQNSDNKILASIYYHWWPILLSQKNLTESTLETATEMFHFALKCSREGKTEYLPRTISLISKFAMYMFGFGACYDFHLIKMGVLKPHHIEEGKKCLDYMENNYLSEMTWLKKVYHYLSWCDYLTHVKDYSRALEYIHKADQMVHKGQFKRESSYVNKRLNMILDLKRKQDAQIEVNLFQYF